MRVAITVFGSTISPLFDAARRLVVADVHHGDSRVWSEEEIGGLDLSQRIALLTRLRVTVLACGAISEFSENALLERNIEVYPWVSGDIQDVLAILARRCGPLAGETEPFTKLAIPTTGPGVGAHVAPTFRSCSHVLFVETHNGRRTAVQVADGFAGGGGCYQLAKLIVEADARVLLTGRCGPNALGILAVAGVEVIQGVEGSVEEAVDAFSGGSLRCRPVTPAGCGSYPTRGRGTGGARGGRERGGAARGRGRGGGHRRRGRAEHLGVGPSIEAQARRQILPGLVPVVDEERCSGCRTCELVCPNGAITVEEGTARVDSDKCIRGGTCVEVCPEQALRTLRATNKKEKDNARI